MQNWELSIPVELGVIYVITRFTMSVISQVKLFSVIDAVDDLSLRYSSIELALLTGRGTV